MPPGGRFYRRTSPAFVGVGPNACYETAAGYYWGLIVDCS
jgi:hypothetical protein